MRDRLVVTGRRVVNVIRIAVIAVVAVALWWLARSLDAAKLGAALRAAPIAPLVVAAALHFVCLWAKAVCWRVMLLPRHRVSIARLFRYTIVAFAASAIAPARAGEVLRVWTLKRRDGVPVADSTAVAVAEKLLDGITMIALVAPVPWLLPDLPAWVGASIAGCAAVALLAFLVLYIVVGRATATAESSLVRRLVAGMHVVRSPRRLVQASGALLIVWLADLAQVLLVLHALGIVVPLAGGLLILFAINLTIVVPSTPAQVGALEVGAIAACDLLGVPREQAMAFALLYHALQIIPLVVVGLALEMRLVIGREATAER